MQWTAEKRRQVLQEIENGARVGDVCRRYGISRQTYYNWKKRFEAEGLKGLEDKSRAPRHPQPRKTPLEKIQRVKSYALDHPSLTTHGYAKALRIPKSTIHRILAAEKISTKRERYEFLERLSQKKQLSEEQIKFLAERNPTWNDFAHDWGGIRPHRVWQLGLMKKSPKEFLILCIHTSTGYMIYLEFIANPKYDNRLPIYIDALEMKLRNRGDVIVRNDILRERIKGETPGYGTFILTGIADQAPYGMLQAFETWLKSFKRSLWEQTDRIRDTWNNKPKPYYPFFGRSPKEALADLVKGLNRKEKGND